MNQKIEDLSLKLCEVKKCFLSENFGAVTIEAEGLFFGKIDTHTSTMRLLIKEFSDFRLNIYNSQWQTQAVDWSDFFEQFKSLEKIKLNDSYMELEGHSLESGALMKYTFKDSEYELIINPK